MISFFDTHPEIVNLARRYHSVPLDQEDLDGSSSWGILSLMTGKEAGQSIQDIARQPLTVVLGEARSGKTTEFMIAADALGEQRKPGFFLRIEDLAYTDLAGPGAITRALEAGVEEDFETWLNSDQEATFFLDSVDEAKLQRVGDYRRAIRTFQKSLPGCLGRVRLVVSCRVTEWRPKDDIVPLRELLPYLAKAENNDGENEQSPEIALVQILPLDTDRMTKLAAKRGLQDSSAFINAIHEADAKEYAGRPGDAIDLIDIWIDQKRLGTLTELVNNNIERKLAEEGEAYSSVISIEKARAGADRLAAASVLCGQAAFRFSHPDQDQPDALPALDPFLLLPDWKREEVEALLRRPVFDEATYGRVRFHTKSVREVLAASWFHTRHIAGCPAQEIVDVFFIKRYGRTVIDPTLTSVAAWLAPHIPELLENILKFNPEVLPDEGDPQALPTEIRKRVLIDFVKRYSDRSRTGHGFDRNGLRRFAHDDLAETIIALLQDRDAPGDIKTMLLRLVEIKKIKACVDVAFEITMDETEHGEIRISAVSALNACDAVAELRKLYESLRLAAEVPERFYGYALYEMYPTAINVEELIELIHKIPNQVTTASHYIKDMMERRLAEELDVEHLRTLIPAIMDLAQASAPGPHGVKAGTYYWLYGSLCICIGRWLEATDEIPEWLFQVLDFVEDQIRGDYQTEQAVNGANETLRTKPPEFREALFLHFYERFAAKHKDGDIRYLQLRTYEGFLELLPEDVGWLLQRVHTEKDDRRRYAAFDAALDITHKGGGEFDRTGDLAEAAAAHPLLKSYWEIQTTPPTRSMWEYKHEIRGWVGALKKRWKKLKAQERILPQLQKIAAGDVPNELSQMYGWMKHSGEHFSGKEPASLEAIFGVDGVDAYRKGSMAFWRTWDISLDKPDGQTRVGDYMALIGVACSVEKGLDFAELDRETVQHLTRLAFKEIQFPKWFPDLVLHHPDVVRQIVWPWLASDIAIDGQSTVHPSILSDIASSPVGVIDVFVEPICEAAAKAMPLAVHVRSNVIRILSQEGYRDRLAKLTREYFTEQSSIQKDDLFWFSIWFQIEALPALDWLEGCLAEVGKVEAGQIIFSLAALLDPSHSGDAVLNSIPDYRSVAVLRRLIPLVYTHLRIEEAPVRYGSWRPDNLDAAYSFRGSLIRHLAGIEGEEAFRALAEIYKLVSEQGTKDWVLCNMDEKVARDAMRPWSIADVIEFDKANEHAPHTSDDLCVLAIKRLVEVKDKLETGDYSLRELFEEDTHERLLQKYIAERLDELSRGRYAVARETEVDDQKEPDIRLLCAGINPTSIEIKWAHKWRLVELEEALSDQLVGQYLKAADSSHGVLLIVNAEPGKTWSKRGMKARFDFSELTDHLSNLARQIEQTTPGVSRLEVVGIDCT